MTKSVALHCALGRRGGLHRLACPLVALGAVVVLVKRTPMAKHILVAPLLLVGNGEIGAKLAPLGITRIGALAELGNGNAGVLSMVSDDDMVRGRRRRWLESLPPLFKCVVRGGDADPGPPRCLPSARVLDEGVPSSEHALDSLLASLRGGAANVAKLPRACCPTPHRMCKG